MFLSFIVSLGLFANADFLVKGTQTNSPLKQSWVTESIHRVNSKSSEIRILRSVPRFMGEWSAVGGGLYQEILIPEHLISKELLNDYEKQKKTHSLLSLKPNQSAEGDFDISQAEVRVLLQQGPWANRVNFTIVGDGYLQSEKEKFFADAIRISNELFTAKTFKSYSPLFNVSAVFVPSNKSGIGDGQPIDTAFKLYRTPKGSKRAIYPGNERALDAAIAKAPATSYPIVIANDEYYGGLGGKYSISTSSERSGLIVLRHELGHSVGEVGEEYDDGQVYMGANSSRSPQTSWRQWIQGPVQVHEAKMLGGEYLWKNLDQGAFVFDFKTLGIPGELLTIDISSVGWDSKEDVEVSFDNQKIDYEGNFSEDRNFFNVGPVAGISSGSHRLKIEEKVKDGNNVLGFARVYSYPANYNFQPDVIGAFATYSTNGQKTYRPTHNSCLMRNMLTEYFCAVDQENLWLKMLRRVRLIDSLEGTASFGGFTEVTLKTIELPELQVRWNLISGNSSQELIEYANLKTLKLQIPKGAQLKAEVAFQTPEVRTTVFKDSAVLK